MSLYEKTECVDCPHAQYWHNGNHLKGHKTICRKPGCTCVEFHDIFKDNETLELEVGLYDCS